MTCIRHSKLQCVDCGRPQAAPAPPLAISQELISGGPTMAKQQTTPRPRLGTAADLACQHIRKSGAATSCELFAVANFGQKPSDKTDSLKRMVATGWLVERHDGKFDIGQIARQHYDQLAAAEQPVATASQIAAAREPVHFLTRPPLRKAYMPNSRGTRLDIPEWSIPARRSFHTKA